MGKIAFFLILGLVCVYISPLFWKADLSHVLRFLSEGIDGFYGACVRTVVFAILSSLLTICVAFLAAVLLQKFPFTPTSNALMSVLLLPALMGDTSSAFVFQSLLRETSLLQIATMESRQWVQLLLLLGIFVWKWGTLCTYIFWLRLQFISATEEAWARVYAFRLSEKTQYLYLPQLVPALVLFFFLLFCFAFAENSISQIVFKASEAGRTELLVHWLERVYHVRFNAYPVLATSQTFGMGLVILLLSVVTLVCTGVSFRALMSFITRQKSNPWRFLDKKVLQARWFRGLLLTSIIVGIAVPLTAPFIRYGLMVPAHIGEFLQTFGITLFTAAIATGMTFLFATLGRLYFREVLQSFSLHSLPYFIGIGTLLLVPPLVVLLSGYNWLYSSTAFNGETVLYSAWIIGHVILSFPLITSLFLVSFFQVTSRELTFWDVYRVPFRQTLWLSFIRRFGLDILLGFLFVVTLIWNEGALNTILAGEIPSFIAQIKISLVGKAASLSRASGYVLLSLLLAGGCILVWHQIIIRLYTSQHSS